MTPDPQQEAGCEVRIRDFERADQSHARMLILAGLQEHFGALDSGRNPDLVNIWNTYIAEGHVFLVAETGGAVVGTGALCVEGDLGQIERVSVDRRMRRRGIGTAMVTELLSRAVARGVRRVWMETNDDWEDALRLYVRCGFAECARRDGCTFLQLKLDRNPDPGAA